MAQASPDHPLPGHRSRSTVVLAREHDIPSFLSGCACINHIPNRHKRHIVQPPTMIIMHGTFKHHRKEMNATR